MGSYHHSVLYGVITAVVLHLLLSLLLFLVFSTWSFLSFFVGLIPAIIFPFFGGLALGVKIMLWRQVVSLYRNQLAIIKVNREYEVLKNNDASNGQQRTGKMETICESPA